MVNWLALITFIVLFVSILWKIGSPLIPEDFILTKIETGLILFGGLASETKTMVKIWDGCSAQVKTGLINKSTCFLAINEAVFRWSLELFGLSLAFKWLQWPNLTFDKKLFQEFEIGNMTGLLLDYNNLYNQTTIQDNQQVEFSYGNLSINYQAIMKNQLLAGDAQLVLFGLNFTDFPIIMSIEANNNGTWAISTFSNNEKDKTLYNEQSIIIQGNN